MSASTDGIQHSALLASLREQDLRHSYFVFGIHGHQPVGNFEKVLEQAYQQAYLPFFQVLARHPQVKFVFHSCGYLLEWIERSHPEFFDSIGVMVARGQLEILGGGFYEPVLAAISPEDGRAQLERLSDYLETRFGRRPEGMWLAERVWEPHMPVVIARAGLRYALVDDFHFLAAGRTYEELRGYFSAEYQGEVISLFPISEKLRYLLPFRLPQETIEYFRSLASDEGMPLLVMVDDAEKFGIWPKTYQWVYEERWLENFLESLEQNRDWLHTVTFSEFLSMCPPLSTAYLPSGSYFEMGEWTLPPVAGRELEHLLSLLKSNNVSDRFKPFVKGGNWLNYFVKYPESNHMHKRAQWISRQYQARKSPSRASKDDWRGRGLAALYRAQCNDGYWHGVFGGLYLPHLRHAIYENLIEAEFLLERSRKRSGRWNAATAGDLDWDQKEEVLLSTEKLTAFVDAAEGGAVYELDFKPRRFNLADNLARRPESYHGKLLNAIPAGSETRDRDGSESIHDLKKEFNYSIAELQRYDLGRRGIFQDQLLWPQTEFENYRQWDLPPADGFFLEAYALNLEGTAAVLSRRHRWRLDAESGMLAHEKTVRIVDLQVLQCQHRWLCEDRAIMARHLCGLNFSFLTDDDPQKYLAFNDGWDRQGLSWIGSRTHVRRVEVADGWARLRLLIDFEPSCEIWAFPIKTISQSESGYEQNYQCSFIGALWSLQLAAGQWQEARVNIAVEEWSP